MLSFLSSRNLNLSVCFTAGTLIIIALVSIFIRCFSPDIWLDEAFSLHFVRYGWYDLLIITATNDVHPPLYYLIAKLFIDIGTIVTSPGCNLFFGKLASFTAILCCVILTGFKVYRQHGNASAAMMCAMGVCAPLSICSYGEEIRMYPWACFFVTAAYLWAWDVMMHNRRTDWCLLCFFGICAAYTHHYALIAIAFIHLPLFLYITLEKRDLFMRWFGCILASAVLYLPGLLITCSQTNRVNDHWWMLPLTGNDILNCFNFCYHNSAVIITIAVIISCLLLVEIYRNKQCSFRTAYLLTGLFLPLALFTVGLTLSWLMRPILTSRYIYPALGCMWIALVLGSYKSTKHSIFSFLCCMVLSMQVSFQLFFLDRIEYRAACKAQEIMQIVANIPQAALLFNDPLDAKTFMEEAHTECYLLNPTREPVFIQPFGSISGTLTGEKDIQALVNRQKTLIFAKSPSDAEQPAASFPDMNVTFVPILNNQKENSHRINKNFFELYRITL